jgi:hypothetical protein
MLKKTQAVFYTCWILLTILFVYSPKEYAQFEGISIHVDLMSINFPNGFNNNYYHLGNFLGGLQYNFPINTDFEINSGVDFFYAEATGLINNESKQVETFISSVFVGVIFNFDTWGIFGKAGYSPAGSINQHGGKEWVNTIPGFDIYPVQVGVKYNIFKDLDLTASLGTYFGNSIKIDDHIISLTTLNFGFSYNLFNSPREISNPDQSNDNYRKMYNELLTVNEKLEKQNAYLNKHVNEIINRLRTGNGESAKVDSVLHKLKLISVSVDSINSVYNLHLGQLLSIKDFVLRNKVSEDGKLILEEYNSIASSFKGFPSGIWFVCTVPDTNAFRNNKDDFPRIEFRNDPENNKVLLINVDVSKTETNNGIKLEIN